MGSWSSIRQPDEVLGLSGLPSLHSYSDGENFYVYRTRFLGTLGVDGNTWSVDEVDSADLLGLRMSGEISAASENFLFLQGGIDETITGPTMVSQLIAVLDMNELVWTSYDPVPVLGNRGSLQVLPVGEEFLLWGGRGNYSVESERGEAYFDGTFLNPKTGEWRKLQEAEPTGSYSSSNLSEPPRILWMEGELFAWGAEGDGKGVFGRRYSSQSDSWSDMNGSDGPTARVKHELVAGDGELFVVGGVHPESEMQVREIWKYSLDDDEWEEIEVPDFVDPRKAVWVNGKLYVFGQCAVDAVYDVASGTWSPLASIDLPTTGVPFVSGERIIISQVDFHPGGLSQDAYIYEPEGYVPRAAGGAGGGAN